MRAIGIASNLAFCYINMLGKQIAPHSRTHGSIGRATDS
jgi:hypothetical protein